MLRTFLAMMMSTVLAGCELVADFDRDKIPAEEPDGGMPDASMDGDAAMDVDAAMEPDAAEPQDAGEQPDEDAGDDAAGVDDAGA